MEEFSLRQIRFAFLALLLFCVSIFMSCREVSYAIWGRTIDAAVTDRGIVNIPGRYGSTTEKSRLGYRFVDADGLKREGYQLYAPDDAEVPQGMSVPVEYLSGQYGPSRLAGRREWTWPTLMFGMPIAAVVWSIVYVKSATARPLQIARSRGRR
jgi:hypothetical protein